MADFYEDDEPVEKVRAAYARGAKGVTGPAPRDPNQRAKAVVDAVVAKTEATAQPISVHIRPYDPLTPGLIPASAFDPSEHQPAGVGS